jgi:hypothetical protein
VVSVESLTRWTSFSEAWGEDVGSVAVRTGEGLIFIDPLSPPSELGEPDHSLITVFFHAREARGRVWATNGIVQRLANRGVIVTDPFEPGDPLPGGIVCYATARMGEVVYWLPEQQALAVGDVLLGAGAKPRATSDRSGCARSAGSGRSRLTSSGPHSGRFSNFLSNRSLSRTVLLSLAAAMRRSLPCFPDDQSQEAGRQGRAWHWPRRASPPGGPGR